MGRLTIIDTNRAAELYAAGCSDAEIARQLGCYAPTIFHWRRRTGRAPVFQRPDGSIKAQIIDLMGKGFSSKEIAEKIGKPWPNVHSMMSRMKNPALTKQRNRENGKRYLERHRQMIGRA